MLKGVDAALLVVCSLLNLRTEARPVYLTTADGQLWSYGRRHRRTEYPNSDPESEADEDTLEALNGMKHDPVRIFKVRPSSEDQRREGKIEWVGDHFTVLEDDLGGHYYEWIAGRLQDSGNIRAYGGIHWLNKTKHMEPNYPTVLVRALVYMINEQYGNEPEAGLLYSAAAMLILIPKWDEQRGLKPSATVTEL